MQLVPVTAYLLLIAAAAGIVATVRVGEEGPDAVFRRGRRSRWLGAAFPAWGGAMAIVVAGAWGLRLEHLVAMLRGPAGWPLKAAVVALVVAEAVVALYWLLYVRYCALEARSGPLPVAASGQAPRVLVLVPTCDEPAATLERSVGSAARLAWLDLRVVVVDSSRTRAGGEAAAAVCARHGVERLVVVNRGGKAAALNDAARRLADPAPVLAVLDADQRAAPDLLGVLVPRLLADPGLAFVQSAQGYENAGASLVARAAAQQEMLLYDAIAGGRGALGRAPCCGTNFVMRVDALASVGGWDETTLSEDQVTAFHLHRAGWRSAYHRALLAMGLGPLDLPAYWQQQARWAHGATRMGLLVLSRRAPPGVRVDALWSAGFYLLTLILAALGALPVLLVLLGAPRVDASSWLAMSVYPLYALVMLFPYVHMWLRGYALRDLLLVQGLLAVSVPVYARAVGVALWGGKASFVPTPRAVASTRRPGWRSPPVWSLCALIVVGAALASRAADSASMGATVATLAWTFAATVSAGHYLLFTRPMRYRPAIAPDPHTIEEARPSGAA